MRHPNPAYASKALLELRHSTELTVEVRAPSPDLHFNVLRDSIEDLITHRWPGLTYQLFIPCPKDAAGESSCAGCFPLDGLLQLRENGHMQYPCMVCTEMFNISFLLTGFAVPEQSLTTELKRMSNKLARIESGLIQADIRAAETADFVRRVLRVVSSEVTDCPRLFTFARERSELAERARFYQDHYRLTLWREHPDSWHPWEPASYQLEFQKEWFVRISKYGRLIFKVLQLAVPLAGSIAVASLPQDKIERAQAHLEAMNTIVKDLPSELSQDENIRKGGFGKAIGQLTDAEGGSLRALRAVLFEHDRLRTFGGMHRVQAASGDFLWVCAEHYYEYDPGLPVVP